MSSNCDVNPKACQAESKHCECYYQPDVDIYEQEDSIVLFADLPGAAPETIEVDYHDGELSIQAEVKPRQETNTAFLRREYGIGNYRRAFRITEPVDTEQISAEFTNGVLTVQLPKVQAAKPRRIAVSSN